FVHAEGVGEPAGQSEGAACVEIELVAARSGHAAGQAVDAAGEGVARARAQSAAQRPVDRSADREALDVRASNVRRLLAKQARQRYGCQRSRISDVRVERADHRLAGGWPKSPAQR